MRSSTWIPVAIAVMLAALSCGTDRHPVAPAAPTADLVFVAMAPSYVSTISVDVTGPGISPALTFNFDVVSGIAAGTIRLPTGAERRIVARAYDPLGVNTHRGDTTVTVLETGNPALSLLLQPLIGGQPVTLTIGTNVVDVLGPDTTLRMGDTIQLVAAGVNYRGQAARPEDIAWASGNPGILSLSTGGLVTALSPGMTSAIATFEGAAAGRKFTVAIPTGWIYFSGNNQTGRVDRVHPDGSGLALVRSPRGGWTEGLHELSPDGQFLALSAWQAPGVPSHPVQLVVARTDGVSETVVFDTTSGFQTLGGHAWSPDGQRLVFAWRCDSCAYTQLYLIQADGTGLTQLTSDVSFGDNVAPRWSPDGQRIAFGCFTSSTKDLCLVNSDGTGLTRLTSNVEIENRPVWLSNTRLVFETVHSGNTDLWAMNLDGTERVQLTADPGNEFFPRLSPDGRLISYGAVLNGFITLYITSTTGGGRYRIPTNQPGTLALTAWGPEP